MALAPTSVGIRTQLASLVGASLFSKGHGSAKGAFAGSAQASPAFGNLLAGALPTGTDPLAQLESLVANGTPISTVVDTLANQIATAVGQQLPASQRGSGASRTALVESIKTALSPPSNAPPGSASQEVSALAQRLQGWLSGVARVADQQQGQQSDISGQILDATTAKELPAQKQDPQATTTPSTTGAVALARSLLASVAAALGAGSSLPGGTTLPKAGSATSTTHRTASAIPAKPSSAAIATTSTAPARSAPVLDDAVALSDPAAFTALAGPQLSPSPALGGAPAPAPAPQAAAQTAQTATNASPAATPADLVARMLLRAAGVDAQHNSQLPSVATQAQAAPASRGSGGTTTPTATPSLSAAKLSMLLTEAVAAGAEAGGGEAGGQQDAARDASSNASFAASLPSKSAAADRTDATVFAAAPPSSPASASSSQPSSAASGGTSTVDTNALVEQVVTSMAMRTGLDGTSQVRLTLQPASLGTVTLKLTVQGNSVSATAVAQNADVRTALIANHQQLARSLADAGLKLTGFTVDLSNGQSQQQSQHGTNGFGRRYSVHEVEAAGSESETPGTEPSIVPSSTLGLLSYLA
ncbi:MAG TPA: flagellar hook-length control protein FliK [Verrucomicrobiae bacterium]|nr:flagellar hook-length control protein FliK [Verrucomicrobiae bacterium]